MASLLRDGVIVEDSWLPPAEDGAAEPGRILSLAQWQAAGKPAASAVQLQPDEDCEALLSALAGLALVAIYFPDFMDGRGFSAARRLREAGFAGELRARGDLLPDQAHYLRRCGFNAFEFTDASRLEAALARLSVFSGGYQAAADQPLPRFRRRA